MPNRNSTPISHQQITKKSIQVAGHYSTHIGIAPSSNLNLSVQKAHKAVKDARTKQGLSQERLAEILNLDSRTILNIEAGRGNPKFEILVTLITYLKIPTNNIFYPESDNPNQNFQKLLAVLYDCSDLEIGLLLPMIQYFLNVLHRNNMPEQ